MKILYIVLGVFFLLLGIIGLVLPVVPQVPFLLSAVFFLSKGSPRFESKLKNTKLYQKYISKLSMKLEFHHWLKIILVFTAVIIVAAAVITTVFVLRG